MSHIPSPSEHKGKKTHNQTGNGNNLDRCEPEFTFTISSCTKHIDRDDHNKADGDPSSIVHTRGLDPIVDQHSSSGQFGGKHDDPTGPHMDTEKDGWGTSGARRIQPEIVERRLWFFSPPQAHHHQRRGIRGRAHRRRDWQIPVDRNRDCVRIGRIAF